MADDRLIYLDPSTGLFRANKTTIKESLKQAVRDAYGDVYLDDNYPDGIIINDITGVIDETFSAVQTIYNMLDVNSAEGVVLDTLGGIRNEHRKEATTSKIKSTFILTTIPESFTLYAGMLTIVDENGNYWDLKNDIEVVDRGGGMCAEFAYLENRNPGVVAEPRYDGLTVKAVQYDIPVATEDLIFVVDNFYQGTNEETDLEFRNRINEYTVFNSSTLKENLISELTDLTYLKDVKIYYNNSTQPLTTKGSVYLVPSAQCLVLLRPTDLDLFDTDTDKRKEVDEVIENYKGLGTLCWLPEDGADYIVTPRTDISIVDIQTNAGTPEDLGVGYMSRDTYDSGNINHLAQYIVPSELDVPVITIKYVKTNNFDSTLTDPNDPTSYQSIANVQDSLAYWINNLEIGRDLMTADISKFLQNNTDEIYVANVTITGASNGVLTNNDKILKVVSTDIHLEELS